MTLLSQHAGRRPLNPEIVVDDEDPRSLHFHILPNPTARHFFPLTPHCYTAGPWAPREGGQRPPELGAGGTGSRRASATLGGLPLTRRRCGPTASCRVPSLRAWDGWSASFRAARARCAAARRGLGHQGARRGSRPGHAGGRSCRAVRHRPGAVRQSLRGEEVRPVRRLALRARGEVRPDPRDRRVRRAGRGRQNRRDVAGRRTRRDVAPPVSPALPPR